MQSNYSK